MTINGFGALNFRQSKHLMVKGEQKSIEKSQDQKPNSTLEKTGGSICSKEDNLQFISPPSTTIDVRREELQISGYA